MDIRILVSTHKPYIMPKDDSLYLPIHVGYDEVNKHFGFQGDNTGDNISYKHRFYSDLSAVYWGWKNLNCEYMGSCHYRRYFVSKIPKDTDDPFFRYILSREEVESLLQKCPVIVAKKRYYFVESLEKHYGHTHNPKDLEITRQIIADICPEYLETFHHVMSKTSAHMFNTFIMRKDLVDAFCNFMFPVLFEIEKRVDFTGYNVFESRVCGYIAEFMLDTWLIKNKIEFQEVRLAMLERQNWIVKGGNCLKTMLFPSTRVFKKEFK